MVAMVAMVAPSHHPDPRRSRCSRPGAQNCSSKQRSVQISSDRQIGSHVVLHITAFDSSRITVSHTSHTSHTHAAWTSFTNRSMKIHEDPWRSQNQIRICLAAWPSSVGTALSSTSPWPHEPWPEVQGLGHWASLGGGVTLLTLLTLLIRSASVCSCASCASCATSATSTPMHFHWMTLSFILFHSDVLLLKLCSLSLLLWLCPFVCVAHVRMRHFGPTPICDVSWMCRLCRACISIQLKTCVSVRICRCRYWWLGVWAGVWDQAFETRKSTREL